MLELIRTYVIGDPDEEVEEEPDPLDHAPLEDGEEDEEDEEDEEAISARLATEMLAEGDFEGAFYEFQEAGDSPRVKLGYAIAAGLIGDLDEAGAACWVALEEEIDDPDLLVDLARVSLDVGEADQAVEALERSLALTPDDEEAEGLLARARSARAAELEARRTVRSFAIATARDSDWQPPPIDDPGDIDQLLRYAASAMTIADFREAGEKFEAAAALAPSALALLGCALTDIYSGLVPEAALRCAEALQLETEDVNVLADLAAVCLDAARPALAAEAARRALALAPEDEDAGKLLRRAEAALEETTS